MMSFTDVLVYIAIGFTAGLWFMYHFGFEDADEIDEEEIDEPVKPMEMIDYREAVIKDFLNTLAKDYKSQDCHNCKRDACIYYPLDTCAALEQLAEHADRYIARYKELKDRKVQKC